MFLNRYDYEPDEPSEDLESSDISWREEEQASLQQSLQTVQTQYATERARREKAEQEAELLARENAALEQQLAGMEGCKVWPSHKRSFNKLAMCDFCFWKVSKQKGNI